MTNPNIMTIDRCESNTSLSSHCSGSRGIDSISARASDIRGRLYDKLTMMDNYETLLRMTPPPASSIVPDENGLPLAIFTKVFLYFPFIIFISLSSSSFPFHHLHFPFIIFISSYFSFNFRACCFIHISVSNFMIFSKK